ncbi:MAG: rane protein of unknown function [Blastococcus sp.]|jgi:hypothetical protein|nr:rane protein of unknown function [Blastococcus sp.]
MRQLFALVGVTKTIWLSAARRRVPSERMWRTGVALVLLAVIAWVAFGGHLLFGAQTREMTPAAAIGMAGPVAVLSVTLGAIAAAFVTMYTPGQSVLDFTTVVLPVARWQRATAVDVAVNGVSLGFVVLTSAPFVTPLLYAAGTPARIGLLAVCWLLLGLWGSLVARLIYRLARRLLITLRLTSSSFTAHYLAGAAVLLLALWTLTQAMAATGTGSRVHTIADVPRVLLEAVVDRGSLLHGLAIALGAAALAALGLAAALLLEEGTHMGSRAGLRLTNRRLSDFMSGSLTRLELLQWLRFPTNAVSVVLMVSVFLALVVAFHQSGSSAFWLSASVILFSAVSTVGVGSYGSSASYMWLYAVVHSPTRWLVPKLASVAILWTVLVGAFALTLTVASSWHPADLVALIPTLVAELAIGTLMGLLVPVGVEHSMQSAMAEALAIVATVMYVVVLLSVLPASSPVLSIAVNGLAVIAALIAYVAIVRRRPPLPAIVASV